MKQSRPNGFNYALRLLTRREHSAHELLCKLQKKGHTLEESKQILSKCQHLGFQCDQRFCELICRSRSHQGYGPIRIIQELIAKAVDKDLIAQSLEELAFNWEEAAQKVWEKKFPSFHETYEELQKAKRFLLYRGFPQDIIAKVIKTTRSMMREE